MRVSSCRSAFNGFCIAAEIAGMRAATTVGAATIVASHARFACAMVHGQSQSAERSLVRGMAIPSSLQSNNAFGCIPCRRALVTHGRASGPEHRDTAPARRSGFPGPGRGPWHGPSAPHGHSRRCRVQDDLELLQPRNRLRLVGFDGFDIGRKSYRLGHGECFLLARSEPFDRRPVPATAVNPRIASPCWSGLHERPDRRR